MHLPPGLDWKTSFSSRWTNWTSWWETGFRRVLSTFMLVRLGDQLNKLKTRIARLEERLRLAN